MNYVVFDLEFNQGFSSKEIIKKCPFEIIQIGAVILTDTFEVKDSFNRLVKPQIYKKMNSYISCLTGLTIEKLKDQKDFIEVFHSFLDFIDIEDVLFCTWGLSDMKELFRNIQFYKLPITKIPKNYLNIQPYVSRYLNFPKNVSVSLKDAVKFLNIEFSNNFHDAYYDALYTSRILTRLADLNMTIQVYNPFPAPRILRPKKQVVNFDKLQAEFEKIYERKMTLEEKSIIKLAYLMGKTHQFLE